MVFVGEVDILHTARRCRWVDQDSVVALNEAVPLKVERDALRCADYTMSVDARSKDSSKPTHISVHGLGLLTLRVHDLHELAHTVLDGLNNVRFELSKAVLHTDQVLPVVVLFHDLLVQTEQDASLNHVRVVCGHHLSSMRIESCRVLAELLNVSLRACTRLVNSLATLSGALCELLGLVLDFGMEALEDGENGPF